MSIKLELQKPVGQRFDLIVNGRGYENLTFRALYTSSDYVKEEQEALDGKMSINDDVVFAGRMKLPFSKDNTNMLIDGSTGGDKI